MMSDVLENGLRDSCFSDSDTDALQGLSQCQAIWQGPTLMSLSKETGIDVFDGPRWDHKIRGNKTPWYAAQVVISVKISHSFKVDEEVQAGNGQTDPGSSFGTRPVNRPCLWPKTQNRCKRRI